MGDCGHTRHWHSKNGIKDCSFSTAAFEIIFFGNLFVCLFKNKAFKGCSFFCSVTLALEDRGVFSDTFWEEGNDSLMVWSFQMLLCIWGNSCCFLNQNLTSWVFGIERTCCNSNKIISKIIFVILCSPKKIPGPLKRGGASTCARCGSGWFSK